MSMVCLLKTGIHKLPAYELISGTCPSYEVCRKNTISYLEGVICQGVTQQRFTCYPLSECRWDSHSTQRRTLLCDSRRDRSKYSAYRLLIKATRIKSPEESKQNTKATKHSRNREPLRNFKEHFRRETVHPSTKSLFIRSHRAHDSNA